MKYPTRETESPVPRRNCHKMSQNVRLNATPHVSICLIVRLTPISSEIPCTRRVHCDREVESKKGRTQLYNNNENATKCNTKRQILKLPRCYRNVVTPYTYPHIRGLMLRALRVLCGESPLTARTRPRRHRRLGRLGPLQPRTRAHSPCFRAHVVHPRPRPRRRRRRSCRRPALVWE